MAKKTYFMCEDGNLEVFQMSDAAAIKKMTRIIEESPRTQIRLGTHSGLDSFEWSFYEAGVAILCGVGCYSAFHCAFSGGHPLSGRN